MAITVLSIGLMAGALLMSITFKYSVRSRYVSEAAQLASEKLEDMGRYPAQISNNIVYPDPRIFVPTASTCQITSTITGTNCVGSIAPALTCSSEGACTFNTVSSTYSPLTITVQEEGAGGTVANNTVSTNVNYTDAVYLSAVNGTMTETYQTALPPSASYTTLTFSPNGQAPVISIGQTAPANAGETFDRRWVIEQDQPVAGIRRVTVLVTLVDLTVQPPVTYQMSMVRQ